MGMFSGLFGNKRRDTIASKLEKRLQLPSPSRMRPICHVLIFDTESADYVGRVLENAAATYRLASKTVSEPFETGKYTIICVFPEERKDLLELARRFKVQMKSEGVPFEVNSIELSERTFSGKEGLRACIQWQIPSSGINISYTDALSRGEVLDVLLRAAQ